jgi:hypothetical protein
VLGGDALRERRRAPRGERGLRGLRRIHAAALDGRLIEQRRRSEVAEGVSDALLHVQHRGVRDVGPAGADECVAHRVAMIQREAADRTGARQERR